MNAKPPIVSKSEPALWDMMAQVNPDGRSAKPFDPRRWDLADERIYRLGWGTLLAPDGSHAYPSTPGPMQREWKDKGYRWRPDEKEVSFLNKATGELLTFEYLGVEFTPWAPGWGFLLLGKRLQPPVEGQV